MRLLITWSYEAHENCGYFRGEGGGVVSNNGTKFGLKPSFESSNMRSQPKALVDILNGSAHKILTQPLKLRKVSARWAHRFTKNKSS